MKTTGNLGLKKPDGTDIVDINDLNGNMDILDTAVKAVQTHTTDTVKHITAAERTTWNAKANKSEVAVNRVVAKDVAIFEQGPSPQTIASFTPPSKGVYTVKTYIRVTQPTDNVQVALRYGDNPEIYNYTILAPTHLDAGDYSFVPVTFLAAAGKTIEVGALGSWTPNIVFVSAIITEEG
ncbi:hypothetical protein NSS64_32615 [Paenibacillus sp. FSL H8-0122]|uniref:hypothetical protein n=1 Tax=Paenibacillus sp. FSL H8-0122 TaxID=2954510 RepID=UPI0030FC3358